MEKRHKEILSALVHRVRHLLIDTPLCSSCGQDIPQASEDEREQRAFLWIVRLLTLRAMETRGLLAPESAGSLTETLALLRQNTDGNWPDMLKLAWVHLASVLPDIFALDATSHTHYPGSAILILCCELIGGTQPLLPGLTREELAATFADPDVIGWAYQAYQATARAEINAKCRNGGKVVSRAELAAKTQLFTEPYMVQWLLQNSLGRSYAEAYPQSTVPAGWPYYVQPEPTNTAPERVFLLEELTLLDPCMGCGHFLRAAFDLFVTLYREQYPEMKAGEMAKRILSRHLFGIDLDPRAAQISTLTLYLRAWELNTSESAHTLPDLYPLPEMHLTTVPASLAPGSLQRHLQRYPQDSISAPYLEQFFEGLEQIDILGSLLRVRDSLEQAITGPAPAGTVLSPEELNGRCQLLLERIVASCRAEELTTGSLSPSCGRQHSANLLHLLARRYALITTNPPYLDSRDMDVSLRTYIATHYPAGKRDLYAAFLLRCLDLCQTQGRVAAITMQSWMFNRSFAELRALPAEKMAEAQKQGFFTGLLRETCIEALVHLGAHAFEEITGEIVQCTMFSFAKRIPDEAFKICAWRLVGLKNGPEKHTALLHMQTPAYRQSMSRVRQKGFLALAESPIAYYLSDHFMLLLAHSAKLQTIAHVRQGLATADNARFIRCHWEIPALDNRTLHGPRWFRYAKGGCYQKWAGLMWLVVDWEHDGQRIKLGLDAHNRPRFRDNAPQFAFQNGLTYTFIASGSFGTRILHNALFDVAGTSLFPRAGSLPLAALAAVTSSHLISYLLRVITQDLKFNAGYVSNLPLASQIPWKLFQSIGETCIQLKNLLVEQNPLEDAFIRLPLTAPYHIQALLHTVEGWNEQAVCEMYQLNASDRQAVIDETGTPAGWFPLLVGYDRLPDLTDDLENVPDLPQEFFAYLTAHPRVMLNEKELAQFKMKLRTLYAAGPRSKEMELAENGENPPESKEETIAGAHLPIPAETFLESLSLKLRIHPLSIYWLLEELQATEDIHCRPEKRQLLEDRLSVLILRLLGHRWPHQMRHFESLPAWSSRDGIIPLVQGTGHPTLAQRVRERLNAEEGAPELEQQLSDLTGQDLEQWLRASFFERHCIQFKQRPIAWHLTSTPARQNTHARKDGTKGNAPRTPAFACLLYYHSCSRATLARIRTHYVEPLSQNLRAQIDVFLLEDEQSALASAQERLRELEAFVVRLRAIEEQGFACRELQASSISEELNHWQNSGKTGAENSQRAEAAWQIDINDGVRVNIAPLQLAGVLAREVLKPQDALKAISDRVHWRAEERRWVREGKLPRCGWMDESEIQHPPVPAATIDS